MRLVALSIALGLLPSGQVVAAEPNFLQFSEEPVGQPFTPPHLSVRYKNRTPTYAEAVALTKSKQECTAEVASLTSFRKDRYVACLNFKLKPLGVEVTLAGSAAEFDAKYGKKLK